MRVVEEDAVNLVGGVRAGMTEAPEESSRMSKAKGEGTRWTQADMRGGRARNLCEANRR
jgi:hypothetical protein